jgi:hypothetical protein
VALFLSNGGWARKYLRSFAGAGQNGFLIDFLLLFGYLLCIRFAGGKYESV